MPVKEGRDDAGAFFRWGESGKKYYFDEADEASKEAAEKSALKQGRAAYARGFREPKS